MSALTQLEELVTKKLLPASVLPSQLRSLRLTGVDSKLLDLSALTQLQEFVTCQLHPETVLPRQLHSLQVTGLHMPAQEYLRPASALQQLQRLSLEIGFDDGATETVLQLAKQLPSL
uniref:Uncharacterized protein n=1 Tax=Tetradesmus obliquus TaxID=3088 RepID=A0A383VXN8_TETOB|eukprot:jgi/Sobl393_1/6019/SZX69613.1